MQRSRINAIMAEGAETIRRFGFVLPPFAAWTPDQFRANRDRARHLIDARCGWDITDFGTGRFDEVGLFVFTLRNGRLADLRQGRGMCYAEKLLILRAGQRCPSHTHLVKAEDIINRGGGTLAIKLYASAPDGSLDREAKISVPSDGVMRDFAAGGILRLAPGESVTLLPGVWHAFWAEEKDVLIGEVSTVNDDETDNIFAEPVARFASVEEDTAPARLLVSDYSQWLG